MAAAWAALCAALCWLLCAVGILLAVIILLLLILLFVPSFAKIRYQDEEIYIVVGILFVQVHVYPRVYFVWDRYANETDEAREARLAAKKAKRDAAKKAKESEKDLEKIGKKAAAKGAKITLDAIVTLLQTAGAITKMIVDALRVEQIKVRIPIADGDAAKTAMTYGKFNAWFYSCLAVLNNFIYLDFDEIQIIPVFDEKFERNAYFSCKVSARLFIIVVVAVRLIQVLRREKELLNLILKRKPSKASQ
ncbi:MAG: DUF2953 domain-containing protein [Faecalibacterium sp.]